MSNSCISLLFAISVAAGAAHAATLRALPEYYRPDPFGGVIAADRGGAEPWLNRIQARVARGGYASFHVVAQPDPGSTAELTAQLPFDADLYREFFHRLAPPANVTNSAAATSDSFVPDALIPAPLPAKVDLNQARSRISQQSVEAFWLDVWVPADAPTGLRRGTITLTQGKKRVALPVELTVLPTVIPADDVLAIDHNSYGTSWLVQQYPRLLADLDHSRAAEDKLFQLIHAHHRIFYEHRGIFHQLGYGHAGKVGPEFAPELTGTGDQKRIASWDRFDRHYGPLLDGSAFQSTRRGPHPIPYVYLPINPEWPADYLWWGEPGYATEFKRVVGEMEAHFRQKQWTRTQFELFFNQKKRYKGFEWDGDEIRFPKDNAYLKTFRKLLDDAIPANSPVHFISRIDTSWTMEHQFQELKGVIGLWVAGGGMASWYPDALREVKQRGDTVWIYGGTPEAQKTSSSIALNPLQTWIAGVDGFVRWLTVSPGKDPWDHFEGGGETLIYPGESFGVEEPLASIRLKLERNCLQDLALLQAQSGKGATRSAVMEEVVGAFNHSSLKDWTNQRPALANGDPLNWNNTDIGEALKPYEKRFEALDAGAWLRVREVALAGGAR